MQRPMNGTADFLGGLTGGVSALSGCLIVNADDWGQDRTTTDRTLDCVQHGAVAGVSAMVFMQDSGRAAAIARERGIEVGLHLNLTTPFSGARCPRKLVESQRDLARYLRRHRLSQVVFHPGLAGAFEYTVRTELDEFGRLYGSEPERIDGHHHMHLCANVVLRGLLPAGTIVRRSFSFQRGEKSLVNILYRRVVDRMLARRHRLVDHFFSLAPLEPPIRLQRIFALARQGVVEVETHPVGHEEYRFLTDGEIFRRTRGVRMTPFSGVLAQMHGARMSGRNGGLGRGTRERH